RQIRAAEKGAKRRKSRVGLGARALRRRLRLDDDGARAGRPDRRRSGFGAVPEAAALPGGRAARAALAGRALRQASPHLEEVRVAGGVRNDFEFLWLRRRLLRFIRRDVRT